MIEESESAADSLEGKEGEGDREKEGSGEGEGEGENAGETRDKEYNTQGTPPVTHLL